MVWAECDFKKGFIMRLITLFYIGLLMLLFSGFVNANENNDFYGALNSFASKNGLTEQELNYLLGKLVLDKNGWRQGGVGMIKENIFVILDDKFNGIKISGNNWKGQESYKNEIVFLDGKQVLESLGGVDLAKIIIVIFTPSEVRYIDLSDFRGAKYIRNLN
jgi:hypothetical protein